MKKLVWYIKFFSILSLCVLLFFILQLFTYQIFSDQLRSEYVQRQGVYLSRGASNLEDAYTNYRDIQLPAIQNIEFLSKLSGGDMLDSTDFGQMLKIKNALSKITSKNSSISNLLVFKRGIAVSAHSIYHNIEESIAHGTLALNGLTYEELIPFLESHSTTKVLPEATVVSFTTVSSIQPAKTAPQLLIVHTIGAVSPLKDIYALWFYDLADLHATLSNGSETTQFFALSDPNGLLYTTNEDIDVTQFQQDATYVKAHSTTYFRVQIRTLNLTAYLALDDATVLSALESFLMLRNLLLVSFCVLALVLLFLVLFYFINPLNRFYERIATHSGTDIPHEGSVFTGLEYHLDKIGNDQQIMTQKLHHWDMLLHKNLLVRLIHGDTLSPSHAETLASMPAERVNKPYRVVLIGCLSSERAAFSNLRPALNQFMQECGLTLFTWVYDDLAALALPDDFLADGESEQADSLTLHAFIESLYMDLKQHFALTQTLVLAVGLAHTHLHNLKFSFQEAKSAFSEAKMWHRSGIVFYEPHASGQALYSLSYDELSCLYNILINGDSAESIAYLDALISRLVASSPTRPLEDWLLMQFSSEIRGVVLRVSIKYQERSIVAAFPSIRDFITLSEWQELAHAAFSYIGQIVKRARESEQPLSNELLAYLSEYYHDSSISLTTLAEAFSMSERSLQRYFKDKMQDTFSNVLEKYRLGEAEKLLLGSKHTLAQIAEIIGYTSLSTFAKAFKRRYGVTPSEWVRQNK